jgi:hypothetical protein
MSLEESTMSLPVEPPEKDERLEEWRAAGQQIASAMPFGRMGDEAATIRPVRPVRQTRTR